MKIRRIVEEDLTQVAEIIRRNFDEVMVKHHSPAIIEEFKTHNTREKLLGQMHWKTIFVVEDESSVIATGAIANFGSENEPKVSISNFYVLPERQHQGLGRLLFQHLLKEVREKGVDKFHVPSSRNAVSFYETMGFVIDGNQPDEAEEITWMTMDVS